MGRAARISVWTRRPSEQNGAHIAVRSYKWAIFYALRRPVGRSTMPNWRVLLFLTSLPDIQRCGKTWSSLAHAASVTYVDRGGNLQIAEADPSYPLAGERPHVIDEWQRVPAVWDAVRHAVDELGGEKGAWILTGSSTPHKDEISHSGAGRIGRVRMRPMSLAETREPTAQISLLGLSVDALMQDFQTLGLVFENMVMRDLDVYARAPDYAQATPVRYYHDDSGLEIDVIVERADGRWGAIEIKLSQDKVEEGAKHLIRMRNKVCANSAARVKEPSFMAVVTGMGEAAYQRKDGIYVIPARALGA